MARVLLIDDEEPLRALLRLWLDAEDHEVVEASGGREAMKLVEKFEFELIVTDLLMPDMDGLEVTREVRRRGMAIPIIVMSGASSHDFKGTLLAVAQALGATTILPKPFDRAQLLSAIDDATTA